MMKRQILWTCGDEKNVENDLMKVSGFTFLWEVSFVPLLLLQGRVGTVPALFLEGPNQFFLIEFTHYTDKSYFLIIIVLLG